jgi:hypothetical protein
MTEATDVSSQVAAAAQWLATGGADRTKAVVPQLRQRFSLSATQAVAAIRESHLIKARSF